MDLAIRAVALFSFVYLLTRIIGRRELSSMEPFDLILLIVIGDAIQQGLTQDDYSVTGALIVIGTFAVLQILISYLSYRFPRLRPALDGEPMVVVQDGKAIEKNMKRERITVDEVMVEARLQQVASHRPDRLGRARDQRQDQRHPEAVAVDSGLALSLTEADVDRLLTPADAIAAVEDSFLRLHAGTIENVPRYRVRARGRIPRGHVGGRQRAWARLREDVLGRRRRRPLRRRAVRTGELRALIEADRLGQLRTGSASAVAAKHLARPGARTLGVIGCGLQARTQVACIREALPGIEETVAYCRTPERLAAFCEEVGAEPAESHREAAAADVVVTITTSRDPVLRGEWLQPGALVCAAGANHPRARELDNAVLERAAFVCCDSLDDAKIESGDLIEPVGQGVLDWLEVHELQEVVAGELSGRQADDDIVLFKSNGLAAWDLAVAARLVELAGG